MEKRQARSFNFLVPGVGLEEFSTPELYSSPLKLFGQMNRNLVGSIYGKSSVVIAPFVPIRLQIWPP
jgi:hypothetical protein